MNNFNFSIPSTTNYVTPKIPPPKNLISFPALYLNASKIFDNLWLGDKISSEDETFIRNNNIRVIINCARELPNVFKPFYINPQHENSLKDAFIEYAKIDVSDNDKIENQEKFFTQLPNLVKYIDYKLNTERKAILIHCSDGKQRSATVMAAYIYYKFHQSNNCTMEHVIEYIKKNRPTVFGYGYVYNFKKVLDNFVTSYNTQLQQYRSQLK